MNDSLSNDKKTEDTNKNTNKLRRHFRRYQVFLDAISMNKRRWSICLMILLIISVTPLNVSSQEQGDPQQQYSLDIQCPSEVNETEEFLVKVIISGMTVPVENATVRFNNQEYLTDADGEVILTAPSVEYDTQYSIIANKTDYQGVIKNIIVLDVESLLPKLNITAPGTVVEGDFFIVLVTADDGLPRSNVAVLFNSITYSTNANGRVSLPAPYVTVDTPFSIHATKPGYQNDTDSIMVLNNETILPQLHISAPTTIYEKNSFQVTVTVEDQPIDNVLIKFVQGEYYTDTNGSINITAPSIVKGAEQYLIHASKPGYQNDTEQITVLNQEPESNTGWIFGTIIDTYAIPIEAANVCVILSETVKQCVLTDQNGDYQILVDVGTYTLEVSKTNYHQSNTILTVEKNVALNRNFILEEISEPEIDAHREQINNAIIRGHIGAELTIQQDDDIITHTEKRYADISIQPLEINIQLQQLTLLVDGDEETGKTIVIAINKTLMSLEKASIEYDGVTILEAKDFNDIINASDDGSLPEYYFLYGETFIFILISLTSFSEHTITITSIIEAIGGITTLLSYIIIFVVVAVIIIVPIIYIDRKE